VYLITNRDIDRNKKGLGKFGKKLNSDGPNTLRLMKVTASGRSWQVTEVADRLTQSTVKDLKARYKLDIDLRADWYASLKVACELFDQARNEKKSILFFVHGYNNDVRDVIKAALEIERLYDVIVVPFTWPANGGGLVSGTASYLSDKGDARASAGALNRVVGKIQAYHLLLTAARSKQLRERADERHSSNRQKANELFTRLTANDCPVTINLLCHSMGNYVFKHTLKTSDNATSRLVFDNICLVAADANNENHVDWVGQLDVRKRVNIVINENDGALKASRIKPGKEQLARLGHYTRKLNSPNAHYIDITDANRVDSEHTYFKGDAVRNKDLREMFRLMFNGQPVEQMTELEYHADNNSYRFRK
jgi:esterase/lipase superfamily enzyme